MAKGIRQVTQELSSNANPSANQMPSEHHKPVWNIPLERNPFFTGREDILGEIRQAILSSRRAAFCGLGGIGKTQSAVEYAYRHEDEYSHIFWINAESNETLIFGYGQLVSLLILKKITHRIKKESSKI